MRTTTTDALGYCLCVRRKLSQHFSRVSSSFGSSACNCGGQCLRRFNFVIGRTCRIKRVFRKWCGHVGLLHMAGTTDHYGRRPRRGHIQRNIPHVLDVQRCRFGPRRRYPSKGVVIDRTRAEFTNENVCLQSKERSTWIFRTDGTNRNVRPPRSINSRPHACNRD
jgi:hypothetical protein